jgi:hypothetical protein
MKSCSSFLISFILFFCLIACHTNVSDKSVTQEKSFTKDSDNYSKIFEDFTSQMPELTLPLELVCGKPFPVKVTEISSLDRAKNEGYFGLLGKLTEQENYTAVIYTTPADVVMPVIKTFDKQGNTIDSLVLYVGECGASPVGYWNAKVDILKDMTIVLTDSTISYKTDSLNNLIKSTKSFENHRRVLKLNNKGFFIKVN